MNRFENVGVCINTIVWHLPSHGPPRHASYLLHIPARGLHVGRYPPKPVSLLGPSITLSSSFILVQAIFEPNLFLYKCFNIFKPIYPSYLSVYEDGTECSETSLRILKPIHPSYLSAYENGTESSERSAYKNQKAGNYPEESFGDTQRQAKELISGPGLGAKTKVISFDRTQPRAVTGLITGHNTLRRHLYLLGLQDSPLCRKCGGDMYYGVFSTDVATRMTVRSHDACAVSP